VKKQTFIAIIISTLLMTILAAALSVNLAKANPIYVSLEVNIKSPQKLTYHQASVPVAFTYSAPFEPAFAPVESMPKHYSYQLDGQDSVDFYPELNGSAYRSTLSWLSDGVHNLTITVTASNTNGAPPYYGGHATVNFTVNTAPTDANLTGIPPAESSPKIWISVVVVGSVAAVTFGLAAYLRRKRGAA
jgi:hypothetical protein